MNLFEQKVALNLKLAKYYLANVALEFQNRTATEVSMQLKTAEFYLREAIDWSAIAKWVGDTLWYPVDAFFAFLQKLPTFHWVVGSVALAAGLYFAPLPLALAGLASLKTVLAASLPGILGLLSDHSKQVLLKELNQGLPKEEYLEGKDLEKLTREDWIRYQQKDPTLKEHLLKMFEKDPKLIKAAIEQIPKTVEEVPAAQKEIEEKGKELIAQLPAKSREKAIEKALEKSPELKKELAQLSTAEVK